MATSEELENRIERLYEAVWNGENVAIADELVADDYVIHDREIAEELRGPALYRALASGTRQVFPDASFAVDDMFAAGDRLALRWTMTGTHEGSMLGVEPTGRRVELTAIEIDRFEDGLLAETWTQSDQLGLLGQLDAGPSAAGSNGA